MPCKAETPMKTSYRPELDITPELDPILAAYYMSLIGILRWMVELGRVDICLEVSMMSSHMALPREGHLEQLFHIFLYLSKYHNTEMVLDPSDPVIDESNTRGEIGQQVSLDTCLRRGKSLQICQNHVVWVSQ